MMAERSTLPTPLPTLSYKGRGLDKDAAPESPSPLVGVPPFWCSSGGRTLGGTGLGRGGARERARSLRANQTDAEQRLWKLLRAKRLEGWKFRQYPIGRYIVDFACPIAQLIVEADGGQHNESRYDAARDGWLAGEGWRVIRFWNTDILTNEEGVLSAILAALPPLPNPSPTRGEGLSGVTHG